MVGVYEPVINVKELQVQKIWADGAKAGDETAADITLSGSAAGSTLYFGRLSNTSLNATGVVFRGRTDSSGVFINPSNGITISDTSTPTGSTTGALMALTSTTKGVRLPRLTTAQGTTLSGVAVAGSTSSGMIWYNSDTGKIEYMSGSNIYALAGTIR